MESLDYGYEECRPSVRSDSSDSLLEGDTPGETSGAGDESNRYSSEDRLARKKQSFSRRGAADYSILLRSAVMTAMETQDEGSDDEGLRFGRARRDSNVSVLDRSSSWKGPPASPRKRARILDKKRLGVTVGDDAVASAGELLRAMCTGEDGMGKANSEPVRGVPRRTSRRTSYESKISDTTDGDMVND